jgi:ATP-dependent DNA helicase RecQ
MLYSKKDKGLQSFFIQSSTAPDAIKDARWRNLDALISYSEAEECRHAEILTYYKDTQRITRCGHCDVCDPQSALKIRPAQIYVEQNSQKATAKTKTRKKSLFNSEVLNSADEELFLELKAWRKAKAKELDLPSFVIFGDKTLRELAKKRPQNSDSLSGIYGIGEAKIESFGKDLLSILKSFS